MNASVILRDNYRIHIRALEDLNSVQEQENPLLTDGPDKLRAILAQLDRDADEMSRMPRLWCVIS